MIIRTTIITIMITMVTGMITATVTTERRHPASMHQKSRDVCRGLSRLQRAGEKKPAVGGCQLPGSKLLSAC
jgi:hypothetical protein